MENKSISQIALERIKEEGIKPVSRNIFSMKRVIFWTVVALSFVVGSFAFSLALSALWNNDWDLYGKFGFNFIFRTLPYFWFISLFVFTILAEHYYRKTLLGHRRGFVVIIGFYLVSTTIFGIIFYSLGVGEIIENKLSNNAPVYRSIMINHNNIWSNPKEGLLSGKITRVSDGELEIVDLDGNFWIIDISDSNIRGKAYIEVGERIKIIGDISEGSFFNAEDIRPWMGGRMMR